MSASRLSRALALAGLIALLSSNCKEELLKQTSPIAEYEVLNEMHNLGLKGNGALIDFSASADGDFVFSTYWNSRFSASSINKDGDFKSEMFLVNPTGTRDFITTESGQCTDIGFAHFNSPVAAADPFPLVYADHSLYASSDADLKVEIRYGGGRSQLAHWFDTPAVGSPFNPSNFLYSGYLAVPFEAWDITHNKQLMVAFLDNGDLYYSKQDEAYIFNIPYQSAPAPTISSKEAFLNDVIYTFIQASNDEVVHWDDPSTIPDCIITITPVGSGFPYSIQIDSLSLNNTFLNTSTGNWWMLVRGVAGLYQNISVVAELDSKLNFQGQKLLTLNYGVSYSNKDKKEIWSAEDGGSVVYLEKEQKLYKLNSSLKLEYEAIIKPCELTPACRFNSTTFVEKDGRYFFCYDAEGGGGIVEFNSQGLQEIANLNLSGRVSNLASLGDGFIYTDAAQDISFLSESFSVVEKKYFLPLPDVTLFTAPERVFFSGTSVPIEVNNKQVLSSRLYIGSVGTDRQITFQIHDLGSPILQYRSAFNVDGSATHIVLLQTTELTTDLLFFQTDDKFNAIRK